MKTVIYSVIAIAVVLTLCFVVSLIRSKTEGKKLRWTNLILPLAALLLFVGLFVGSGISRSNLRKELTEMKTSTEKNTDNELKIKDLERKNEQLNLIIGRDEETEKLLEEVRQH